MEENQDKSEQEQRRKKFEHLYNNDNKYDDPIEGDPTKIKINTDISENVKGIWAFIKNTVSFKEGADIEGTIRTIRENISFAGYNVWVLICSIVVASVGLNTNSVAVIIGAMLISPLMGPIRGMGLGVGTNDIKLIIESLKSFGVAVAISLITAFLYFKLTPLTELTSELEARTGPNLMDVFIAFFGGLAGIIAASRGDNSTVIPGVAIATALMPPLCTAGYGLAIADWQIFLGSFYLFTLNTLFICLSTILVVRYLRFPLRHFINPKVERKVKIISLSLLFLVVIPAGFLFYNKVQETVYIQSAKNFLKQVQREDASLRFTEKITYNGDGGKVELILTNKTVSKSKIELWKNYIAHYDINKSDLNVVQGEDVDAKLAELRNDITKGENSVTGKGFELIQQKENEINQLEDLYNESQRRLDMEKKSKINVKAFSSTIFLNNPEVDDVEVYSGVRANDTEVVDTVYAVGVHYKDSLMSYHKKLAINNKIKKQLKIQLINQELSETYSVRVYNY